MLLAAAVGLTAPGAAQAQGPAPAPFRADDFGGFLDVLPPGTNGTANALELGAFLTTGARPPHNDDQLRMYGDLAYRCHAGQRRALLQGLVVRRTPR